ncbi:cornichon [Mycena galopus ATCC 62051]|nr:cornichon [Mycena galopus ATCC 62051]
MHALTSPSSYIFVFAALVAASLMICSLLFLILFSDFEDQRMTKEQLCDTLNQFVIVELVAPAFLAGLFLVLRQWLPFVLNVPVTVYNFNKIRNNDHLFAPSQMKFRRVPAGRRKESFAKIGFYLLSFFVYLYWCVDLSIVRLS